MLNTEITSNTLAGLTLSDHILALSNASCDQPVGHVIRKSRDVNNNISTLITADVSHVDQHSFYFVFCWYHNMATGYGYLALWQ